MNKYTEIMNHVVLTDTMRDAALENIQKKRNAPRKRQWSWEKSLVLAASFVIVLTAAIVFPNLNRGPDVEGPVTYGVTESATQQGGSVNKGLPSGAGTGNTSQTIPPQTTGGVRTQNSAGQPVLRNASPQVGEAAPDSQGSAVVETANDESVQALGPQEVNSRSALEQRMGRRLRMPTVLPFSANQFLYTDYGDGMGGVTESSGNNEIETRTAKLSDTLDPSGDYNVYKDKKVVTINGHAVTLKGNDGKYQVAVWNDGTYSYSVRSNKPLTEAEFTAIVSSMK